MIGIYRKLKCRFGNGDLRVAPDTETMSILLDAILMTGHCYWAKEVLWEMADDFEQEKTMYEPTACMFNKILKSLCASSDPDAPDTAMDIIKSWMELNQQTKLSAKPSSYSYFLLLKTWCVHRHELMFLVMTLSLTIDIHSSSSGPTLTDTSQPKKPRIF